MEETITYHTCSKCGEEKPLTSEYFAWRTDTNNFRKSCRECKNKTQRETYKKNPEKFNKYGREYYKKRKEEDPNYLTDTRKN